MIMKCNPDFVFPAKFFEHIELLDFWLAYESVDFHLFGKLEDFFGFGFISKVRIIAIADSLACLFEF